MSIERLEATGPRDLGPPIIWEWFIPPIYGQGWFIIGFTTFVLDTRKKFGKFWFGFTESVIL